MRFRSADKQSILHYIPKVGFVGFENGGVGSVGTVAKPGREQVSGEYIGA